MKIMTITIVLLSVCAVQVSPCRAADVVQGSQLSATTTVEDVVDSAERMSGRISNHGQQRIDNVQLLVSYAWLWNDDRRSDDASPGWAEFHTLPIALAAGETASFSFAHEHSRPARDDGQLLTTVKVVGLTEWKSP